MSHPSHPRTRRRQPVVPLLLLATLTVLLPRCAPGGRTLTSFHDTDRYTYLPLDMDGDSRIDTVQRLDRRQGWKNAFYLDRDQDGTFEEVVDLTRPFPGRRAHIVFAVDGFPYRTMERLRAQGHFLLFRSVGKMVAPYPSLTGVSWPRILERSPPAGYEAKYFSPKDNRIETQPGGHVFPQSNEIIGSLDHARAYVQVLSYGDSEIRDRTKTAREMRDRGEEAVLLYYLCVDAAGHRVDDGEFVELLLQLDRSIERIFHAWGCRPRLTLVSDHGNNRVEGRYVDVITPLEEAGYRENRSLESPKDFVCPRYGMIGIAPIYTDYQNARAMTEILARTEGVNFAVTWSPAGVHILSDRGEAVIRWRKKRLRFDPLGLFSFLFARGRDYAYDPVTGDPLGLADLMEKDPGLETGRFCREDAWFRATENFPYPDPLRRIVDSFENVVQNPATVLVDIRDGYCSSGPVRILSRSAGTHGNLGADATLGVVGANWRVLPLAVPADRVNRLLHIVH